MSIFKKVRLFQETYFFHSKKSHLFGVNVNFILPVPVNISFCETQTNLTSSLHTFLKAGLFLELFYLCYFFKSLFYIFLESNILYDIKH